MKRDLVRLPKLDSSFLALEKDMETIFRRLFVESQPYSDQLKRLLVINTEDCLDNYDNEEYKSIIKQASLAKLKKDGYIRIEPKIGLYEHDKVRSYILLEFDNFFPNPKNPEFRDWNIVFNIVCHTEHWDIGNYRLRPYKIAGIIDGLINNSKLSGIGECHFAGCTNVVLDENLSGCILSYKVIHMTDDQLPNKE